MRKQMITGLVALTVMSAAMPAVAEHAGRFAQKSTNQHQSGETPMAQMLSGDEGRLHLDRNQRAVWQDYRTALLRTQPSRPDAHASGRPDAQRGQMPRPNVKNGQRPLLAEILANGPLRGTPQADALMRAAKNVRATLSPEQIDLLVRPEASLPKPQRRG